MVTALEAAVLAVMDRHGAIVTDRTKLVNAVGGGLTDPFMVHKAIDSLSQQGRVSITTTTTVAPNGSVTTKTTICKN